MEQLLDLNQFDVSLLERVVATLNNSASPDLAQANQVLMQLKDNVQAWQVVDKILENSQDSSTKFFGLQILEDTIKFRWKALPVDQREGIKNYVVKKIIDLSTKEAELKEQQVYVNKLNLILVQVLKQEWPHNWPSFISDLVASSKTNESLCENNMNILRLLSEEVFDFSKEEMTTEKIKTMKEKLNEEFKQIFSLCELVLNMSQRPSLLTVTLKTLLRFLSWIPLGYIFETNLVEQLLNKFLPTSFFRNDTLRCLTEIGSLQIPDQYKDAYLPVVLKIFDSFLNQLISMLLPPQTNIAQAYEAAQEGDRVFVHHLSLFLTGILGRHLTIFEQPEQHNRLLQSLEYLVKISEVNDPEIFKICLEFWNMLTKELYLSDAKVLQNVLSTNMTQSHSTARKQLYVSILSKVRTVMISRMAKPEEVLVVEDEYGAIVRESTKDTDAISQYKTMRETLVYLTHLNCEDTENIMLTKLTLQCDSSANQFSWNKLNTLCWAIGSISGAMTAEDERRFLVAVIRDLLGLCESKRGKDNKAVIASNIMYVVGQYPRFLRAHWKFLKTVVNKLFEFMHEKHPGVQDMACDTFLKIAQKCRRKFVVKQDGEKQPFVDDLLVSLKDIVIDLEPHQVETFYEACGHMISAQSDPTIKRNLVAKLMEQPNMLWANIMQIANQNIELLREPDRIKDCMKILRINVRVCTSLGHPFVSQLGNIYMDMLNVYKTYSEYISHSIAKEGQQVTQHHVIRSMRGVKTETLKLIEVFISKSEDAQMVAKEIVPELCNTVLGDYKNNIPAARDPEVLSLFKVIFNKLGAVMTNGVGTVFDAVFNVTLEMIKVNFLDFPDHRINFYELLGAVVSKCFPALYTFNAETLKQIIDSIMWGCKHTERNISETSLDIMYTFLKRCTENAEFAQGFYQNHLLMVLQDVFYVLTDRCHKSGFKLHASILQHIFQIVATGEVRVPLFDPNTVQAQNNTQFLREYVTNMLVNAFPNVGNSVAQKFVIGLFDLSTDLNQFKVHLRDFLIRLKEFSAEDNTDLFAEEKARENATKEQMDRERRAAVPGLLNPHEQDMADL